MTSSPVLLMVLVLSIGFNMIAGAQAAKTLLPEQRMDHLVTNINVSQELEGLRALADVGLPELFDEGRNKRKRLQPQVLTNNRKNLVTPSSQDFLEIFLQLL